MLGMIQNLNDNFKYISWQRSQLFTLHILGTIRQSSVLKMGLTVSTLIDTRNFTYNQPGTRCGFLTRKIAADRKLCNMTTLKTLDLHTNPS